MAAQFRSVDAAIIRLAQHNSDVLPPWPDLHGDTPEHVRAWRGWLQRVWENGTLAEAIEVASPVLAGRVGDLCSGRPTQPRRARRIVESVLRYVLRATSRATPFGFFAAVAPIWIAPTANIRCGRRHQPVTRPDAAWLDEVIAGALAYGDVLRHLTVVTNNIGYPRNRRWVVECQPRGSGDDRIGELSVRHTKPVQAALEAARSPTTVDELAGLLAAQFPAAPSATIETMLRELVARRILLTNLAAPMNATDPLNHLIDQLAAVPADAQTDLTPLLEQLREVRQQIDRHDQASEPRPRRTIRTQLMRQMRDMHPRPGPLLAVDVHADCAVALPEVVGHEAQAAASALVRLNPHPRGNPTWREWHARFLDRWGVGAVVPLRQAVDAATGLGYPAGYRGSLTAPPTQPVTPRDRKLLRLAQQAALDGCEEVGLDDEAISHLAGDSADDLPYRAWPHTELRFTLRAASPRALDSGEFTLVVAGTSRHAGTTIGRFLHLADDEDRHRMVAALSDLPTLTLGALTAQLSSPPLVARTNNLARSLAFLPAIAIGEHHSTVSTTRIAVEDLAVSADTHRLFLIWLPTGKVVEPFSTNAVEPRRVSHPLARFLSEITTATAAGCVPFDWAAGRDLPFLPRLRYRRSVLHPARWRLTSDVLPKRRASWADWSHAWKATQARYRIPNMAYLGETDVRIQIDLSEPAHLAVLRSHLDRAGVAVLTEAPASGDNGWIGGRAHEVVLPLAVRQAPVRSARPVTTSRARWHAGYLPGRSEWVYARLYGLPDRQTGLLTADLPQLLSTWDDDLLVDWWFLRYHQPEPHLRVRIRLPTPDVYGDAVTRLGTWAEHARDCGLLRDLTLDTYHPEVGRYGTGTAMRMAESVFAADSAAAVSQLALTMAGESDALAVTAASMADLAAAFTGSVEQGMMWLVDLVPHRSVPAPPRLVYDQAVRFADPARDWAELRKVGGDQVIAAWQRRHELVAGYRRHLGQESNPHPDEVLASLLHLHHARMVGIDPDTERLCLHLARAAALRWTAHTPRSAPSACRAPTPEP